MIKCMAHVVYLCIYIYIYYYFVLSLHSKGDMLFLTVYLTTVLIIVIINDANVDTMQSTNKFCHSVIDEGKTNYIDPQEKNAYCSFLPSFLLPLQQRRLLAASMLRK